MTLIERGIQLGLHEDVCSLASRCEISDCQAYILKSKSGYKLNVGITASDTFDDTGEHEGLR